MDIPTTPQKSSNNKLFYYIIIALLLGVIIGQLAHTFCSVGMITSISTNIKLLGTIFIRLVQMIIAPLVFCTITVGICKMGDMKMVGRVGGKAMLWFISASLVSLLIGLVWVNITHPGTSTHLDLSQATATDDLIASSKQLTIAEFVNHVVPKSLFEAMAHNEILQILVFAIIFSIALTSFGKKAEPIIKAFDLIAHAILKMVNYIMWVAPIAVFGTIMAAVTLHGLSIFKVYAHFLLAFILGIITLWIVLLIVGFIVLGKDLFPLLKAIRSPLLIAFSTTSSEAVFPKLVDELEKVGCSPKVVSFILPLGYSFNLDGSMMYMTFASIFIAQLYGVEMNIVTQITMLLVLMLTSKGIAGVPRASLIIIIATCSMFGIPPEGVALLIPIDHFCDMARSMTNVLGNALATTVVSKWENSFGNKEEAPSHVED
ncbi:MAG: cation:dicarboxylase symporter family transporter [Dysgonomonas sp.]